MQLVLTLTFVFCLGVGWLSFLQDFKQLLLTRRLCAASAQVFSFKLRGAYNKMASLTAEQREKGVLTSSAGNHAQGVALAASRLVRACLLASLFIRILRPFRILSKSCSYSSVWQGCI